MIAMAIMVISVISVFMWPPFDFGLSLLMQTAYRRIALLPVFGVKYI